MVKRNIAKGTGQGCILGVHSLVETGEGDALPYML